ncbi:ABC transporter permease [Dongia soli]|uniref:ABC transporter permease n=1 Tax=Dongia soli TaxID=600628 RepID=A0ABU5EDI6_9PROT|nr:ABC transporter permease [Dongia soli]MDY0884372.1 ABC transporter permease [Dongia soli]
MSRNAWLIVPAIVVILCFFFYPVSWLLIDSFSRPKWGIQNYEAVLGRLVYLKVLLNTFTISAGTTFWCAVIGYPVAYTMAHCSKRARRLLIFVVLIPFWTSLLVRTFAWMVLLQKTGLINQTLLTLGVITEPVALIYNRIGVYIGMVQVLLPFLIFPLFSVMLRIDRNYSFAAATLGAPPVRNFFRIYLPLTLPGLVSGGTLVFVSSLGYYITPALLGGPADLMIAQLIERQISTSGNWGMAGALAVLLLVATAICLGVVHRIIGVKTAWGR